METPQIFIYTIKESGTALVSQEREDWEEYQNQRFPESSVGSVLLPHSIAKDTESQHHSASVQPSQREI